MSNSLHQLGRGQCHHRRHDIAVVRVLGQRVVDCFLGKLGVGWQVDELFRSAVDLASLEIHDATAQRHIGGGLVPALYSGVNVQTAGIGFTAILSEYHLAYGLGHMLPRDARVVGAEADFQFFTACAFRLFAVDEAIHLHPVDDVLLPRPRSGRIADRVIG